MSYGTGLLTTSYPSTLLSDGYLQRSNYETTYPPSMSYMNDSNTDRLFNDDLSYNPIPPRAYGVSQSNGFNPKPGGQKPPPPAQGNKWSPSNDIPDSLLSMNDMTEYSESMGTASNTNTASSVARTIDEPALYGPTKKTYQPAPNPAWNQKPIPTTNNKKGPPDDGKRAPQYRAAPKITKKPAANLSKDESKPVPASQAHHGAMTDVGQTSRSMNIEAWLNEADDGSPGGEPSAEQAWSDKMNQLQMAKIQREQDKIKSSRALPIQTTKRFEPKSNNNQSRQNMTNKSQEKPTGPYSHFDTLFDGDFYRPTNYPSHPNYVPPPAPKPKAKRPKPPPQSQPEDYLLDDYRVKPTKHIPPSRTSRYDPPTMKRPPGMSTTAWRSQWARNYMYDSYYPYYLHPDYLHHDYIHKDEEERYREALQVMRAERAEQQQKQISETTAKRLNYGDYVRNSTKEGSLPNAVKPSPWSDFMDLKKGNIYDIAREEKKQLYHQSKSYGERVRHRNVGFSDTDLALSHRASMPYLDDVQEPQPSNVTPRQTKHDGTSKSISRASKHRPDSASTKRTNVQRNPDSRNHRYHRSDEDHGTQSDTGVSQKSKRSTKKKNVHYDKHNTSGRMTSGAEDSDTEVEDRSVRLNNQPRSYNIHMIKEVRTPEHTEGMQHKKIIQKQKK